MAVDVEQIEQASRNAKAVEEVLLSADDIPHLTRRERDEVIVRCDQIIRTMRKLSEVRR